MLITFVTYLKNFIQHPAVKVNSKCRYFREKNENTTN